MARILAAMALVASMGLVAGFTSPRYEFVMPPFVITASQDMTRQARPLLKPNARAVASDPVCGTDVCNSSVLCDVDQCTAC